MSSQPRTVAAAVAVTLALGTSTAAAQESPWSFEISPYLWAAGIDADVKVRDREGEVDVKFDDVLDRLDKAGSLFATLQHNKFVIMTQLDYLSTDTDELDADDQPAGGDATFESELFMGTFALGYRFGSWQEKRSVDVLLGARQLSFDSELTIDGLGNFKAKKKDFYDPVLFVRPTFRLSDRWRFIGSFAYGAGGDSESTYELQPMFQFLINDHISVRFGYRRLYYDIESSGGANEFDGSFQGPILGISGAWGKNYVAWSPKAAAPAAAPQPVAAVAPPPPPPPAPPPGDTDGDGIADNIDKCERTAAGEKVDAVGCAFNVKVEVQFATNSADLTPESHQELDRLVEVLNSTPTIAGYVDGYTDSSGSAEHNRELSRKRAEAVADYLISHGVSRDRVITKGHGESNPVADNGTAEGRAENRRVILRRVDADR
jgi:outer membrane protein OmpA-like peptidoglycan-associated protein